MLFNSYIFVFVFLPATALVFFSFGLAGKFRAAAASLVLASLIFYGYWAPPYLALIVTSVLANYAIGRGLERFSGSRTSRPGRGRGLLIAGVALNLALIGYFKYADFFLSSIEAVLGHELGTLAIVLPLGISFFTFQQIAYLVDVRRSGRCERDLWRYSLFVTFFPQLIAGPIVHHGEMLPQFARPETFRPRMENIAVGWTIFVLGLGKKVLFADSFAVYATPVFEAADIGTQLSFFEAWCGLLAYTFQIYFDFSGYSDMAIGLAWIFGIRLPINFNSPYKARNVIDFWRRWHITLSRFLRDYLYFPLGGNRKGPKRRYVNLMTTMLLGGLWHGAAWNFVIWGGLHGLFLCVNHLWERLRGTAAETGGVLRRVFAQGATFLAVALAWVFFRAETTSGAWNLLGSALATRGISVSEGIESLAGGVGARLEALGVIRFDGFFNSEIDVPSWLVCMMLVLMGALVSWLCPNTQEIMRKHYRLDEGQPGSEPSWALIRFKWRPVACAAFLVAAILVACLVRMSGPSEFLYFQF